jgi:acetyl esterase/lipase
MKRSSLLPALALAVTAALPTYAADTPATQARKDVAPKTAPAPAAAPKAKAKPKATPEPTMANVAYGTHERQVLDFWKANSDKPTPLLFFIHGGGWVGGDKAIVGNVQPYLDAGISVVSINYRYNTLAQQAGVKPPVSWPLGDAARALQFVRSKAKEWNIDKERIGASGGSAGACSSLWLAFHPDMADAKSSDPIARESTRLWCAAVNGAQTTLDPQQMKEWTPNSRYGGHAFGFMPDPKDPKTRDTQFAQFLADRESVLPWIQEYSPYAHVSKDDPPIYMNYSAVPALGQEQKDPTHTANFGVKLEEKIKSVGGECELWYPGAPGAKHATSQAYLLETLKAPRATKA